MSAINRAATHTYHFQLILINAVRKFS